MLYELVNFSDQIAVLNVFKYITFRTGGAIFTALLFVMLFGPGIIDLLRVKQGKGQPIRDDGPKTHLLKSRHADHGRPHDHRRRDGGDAAVGPPRQPLHLDRARRHAQLRRHRLLRRLPQGDAAHELGLLEPDAAAARAARCRDRDHPRDVARAAGDLRGAHGAVLQERRDRARAVLRAASASSSSRVPATRST